MGGVSTECASHLCTVLKRPERGYRRVENSDSLMLEVVLNVLTLLGYCEMRQQLLRRPYDDHVTNICGSQLGKKRAIP